MYTGLSQTVGVLYLRQTQSQAFIVGYTRIIYNNIVIVCHGQYKNIYIYTYVMTRTSLTSCRDKNNKNDKYTLYTARAI